MLTLNSLIDFKSCCLFYTKIIIKHKYFTFQAEICISNIFIYLLWKYQIFNSCLYILSDLYIHCYELLKVWEMVFKCLLLIWLSFEKNSLLWEKCFFLFRASEGKTVEVPYRGSIEKTVLDVLGGLRSACTYTGAGKLKELPRRTTFVRVTQQTNEIFFATEVRD